MVCLTNINLSQPFTSNKPLTLHLDINSCFATLEQQANPLLRNKPVVVTASPGKSGCILAASYDAKKRGIKTGMRMFEAKNLLPSLISLPPDPDKYRYVHHAIRKILNSYTDQIWPKSIDEFVLNLANTPYSQDPSTLAREIKLRITKEVGEYITVSIGIAPNRILAKLGSDIDKPDGLQIIDKSNYLDVYKRIELTEFCGISTRTKIRLNKVGIVTSLQFYQANIQTLKTAFGGVIGRDWYYRLRGIEVDDWETTRRVFGNSYVLPQPMTHKLAHSILTKLVDKSARRLRLAGYTTSIINLYLRYQDKSSYHQSLNFKAQYFDTRDILRGYNTLYNQAPHNLVKHIAISCSGLSPATSQPTLFGTVEHSRALMSSLDQVNSKYGPFTLRFGSESSDDEHVHDTIAFGR